MEDGSPLPPVERESLEPSQQPDAALAAEQAAREAGSVAAHEAMQGGGAPETVPGAEEIQAADIPQGIVQRETSLDLPSIIIIDPNIPVPDDLGPLPQIYPAPSTYPPQPAESIYSSVTPPAATPAAPVVPRRPAAHVEYASPTPGAMRASSAPRRVSPWVWGMASVLLLVLLLAQTTYFLRDTLVSRLPQTRPALEQACAVLGCTLSLPKNLALLQIVGSDLQTEASGRLKLTLTLGNRATHVQAWPVLVLTLTDQRNRPLARRSFAPSEYLGDDQRIAAGVPELSEQPLSLRLTVRDLAPMGFDLQLAY